MTPAMLRNMTRDELVRHVEADSDSTYIDRLAVEIDQLKEQLEELKDVA